MPPPAPPTDVLPTPDVTKPQPRLESTAPAASPAAFVSALGQHTRDAQSQSVACFSYHYQHLAVKLWRVP